MLSEGISIFMTESIENLRKFYFKEGVSLNIMHFDLINCMKKVKWYSYFVSQVSSVEVNYEINLAIYERI